MRALFLSALISFALVLTGSLPAPEQPAEEAPQEAVAATAPIAAPVLPIPEAIEGLLDEDEATRKAALKRLEQATEADIPALEKYADDKDPDIHRQVTLLLRRLKRGELVFNIAFADDKPAAGVKVSVRIYNADQVQLNQQGEQFRVQRKTASGGMADPLYSGDYTADAAGRISVGRYNDGNYLCLIESSDPLPTQSIGKTIKLRENTSATKITLKRGVTATVTVLDADGAPLADAQVHNIEDEQWFKTLLKNQIPGSNNMGRNPYSAVSDARGIAVLERIGLKEIHILAVKDGYDVAAAETKAWQDGGTIETTVRLQKTKPVRASLQINTNQNKPLAETRVLLIAQAKQMAVVGIQWYQQANAKEIDAYIEKGALDLKLTDAKGTVTADVMPNQYMLLCFSGKKVFYGVLSLPGGAAENSQTVSVQELQRQK